MSLTNDRCLACGLFINRMTNIRWTMYWLCNTLHNEYKARMATSAHQTRTYDNNNNHNVFQFKYAKSLPFVCIRSCYMPFQLTCSKSAKRYSQLNVIKQCSRQKTHFHYVRIMCTIYGYDCRFKWANLKWTRISSTVGVLATIARKHH